jgi:ABC-type Na+ efflux pump permease subunit
MSIINILIIARHEVVRFKSRFTGKTRLAIILVTLLALSIFFFVSMGGFTLNKGFYTVGISADSPRITDPRFNVIEADYETGMNMLSKGMIDVYVDNQHAYARQDQKSQYTAGALKQYLEQKDLIRISNQYPIDKAFPLRVEINYLKTSSNSTSTLVSLADIIGSSNNPSLNSTTGTGAIPNTSTSGLPDSTDSVDKAVQSQVAGIGSDANLHQFKAEFASDKEIIVPSLMNPPIPLSQVLLTFFYIVPIFFIIIFFTSSFIEEKLNRRLSILLSAPVRPIEIILGKMLPYLTYSIIVIIAITLFLKGNILESLAIFIPVVLFILAVYLGVALLYRTFKDQTYFSMLAVVVITLYLIFPAMFTGINNICYVSPLTLAVQMYRGEAFDAGQYLVSTGPMYLIFILSLILGTRVFNEEFLMNYKPLFSKAAEAIYFAMDKKRLTISVFAASLLIIPAVYMVELGGIAVAFNLPMPLSLWMMLIIAVIVEEVAKSAGVAVLIKNRVIRTWKQLMLLAVISALAFFLGEKLVMFLTFGVISPSIFTGILFSSNMLWLPLALHIATTTIVCIITYRLGTKAYPVALLAGMIIHLVYNSLVMGVLR